MAKEISIIRQEAQQVQNATQVGENTAQRVGGVLVDIVDKAEEHETDIDNLNSNTGVDEYPVFSESTAYSAGDVVNYNGKLYKFTADHAAGAWTGTDVEETKLTDLIISNFDNVGLLDTAAHITGYIRVKAEDYYAFEKRFIMATDGKITEKLDTNPDARIIKIDVSAYRNGTIEYSKIWTGTIERAALAFYTEDFKNLPTSKIFLKAIPQNPGEHKKVTETIPENAKIALVQTSTNVENDDIVLRIPSEETSSFDERIEPLLTEQEDDYIARDNNNLGKYDHIITSYETGAWLDDDGNIQRNNGMGFANRAIVKVPILDKYKGGRIGYYTTRCWNVGDYRLAFYNSEDTLLGGDTDNTENMKYWEANIPDNAAYLIYQINTDNYKDSDNKIEDYPITFFSQEGSLTVYENRRLINMGQKYYMEPLGINDNFLTSAISKNYAGAIGIDEKFLYDQNGILYGIKCFNGIRTNIVKYFNGCYCLKIKKNDNAERVLQVMNISGTYVDIKQDAQIGYVKYQGTTNRVYVVRNDKDYIWIYGVLKGGNRADTVTSFSNSSKTSYDKLEIDENRSFILNGDYSLDDYATINFDRKYYKRYEKLHSQIAGKTAVVFADSLAYFNYQLVNDWGLNVITISMGGGRMSYATGNESTWVCNDDIIQAFKKLNVKNVDFIIFACGANDSSMQDCDAETLKFVLNNKRWFHSDALSDPFDSLEEGNKLKFTSSACTYAAAYSLCRIYKGALVAIIPPYRTPGETPTDFDVEKFVTSLFNGRFINCWNVSRAMAEKLGAVYIENWTRDNVASSDAYHTGDGVHPSDVVAQDMASNIGHALSRYYDFIKDSLDIVDQN